MIALTQFEHNYEVFVNHHGQSRYVVITEEVDIAFRNAEAEKNVAMSARTFSRKITTVLDSIKSRQEGTKPKWTTKLGGFLQKIYPIARLTLNITSSVSEATPLSMPLKVLVNGLSVILQVQREVRCLTTRLSTPNCVEAMNSNRG